MTENAMRSAFLEYAKSFGEASACSRYVFSTCDQEVLLTKRGVYLGPYSGTKPVEKSEFDRYLQVLPNIPALHLASIEQILPENMYSIEPVDLPEELVPVLINDGMLLSVARPPKDTFPSGIWLANGNRIYGCVIEYELKPNAPLRPVGLIDSCVQAIRSLASTANADDIKLSLSIIKDEIPVVILSSDTGMIVFMPIQALPTHTEYILPDGSELVADAFDASAGVYAKLIKKRKKTMAGLKSLDRPIAPKAKAEVKQVVNSPAELGEIAQPAQPAPVQAAEPAVENTVVEVSQSPQPIAELEDIQLPEIPDGAELVEVETGKQQQVQEEEAKPEAEAAPEQEVQAEKEPKRRQRAPRQPKAPSIDFDSLTQQLSAPIEDLSAEQLDAAINEIRALRDLIIVSARRAANLNGAVYKLTKSAVEKYGQISQIMNLK